MASSLRELRQRRQSVTATKKITRAMELIASSQIVKAQQIARNAMPYTTALTHAVSALASHGEVAHPLLEDRVPARRSAMLVVTGDRGLAGAYSSNVIKAAEQLYTKLTDEGQEVVQYITGNKGVGYFEFRNRPVEQKWTGFSDKPQYSHAREIAEVLIEKFLLPYEEGGVDQIHVVGTRFISMLSQQATATRLLPLVVEETDEPATAGEIIPFYTFEPSAAAVLDQLLPLYVANRVYTVLLQSGASELASRQTAMKAATDNAQQLIERLTREANQARQAEITQEISEITGGAAALAESAGNE
ncbi:F0F1 ATP synthase subunit gamma [Tessaracoccus rhinocerotis]|uniref:ATP synthase gamma chain n=1 Tax=Tessaracoccus rhinocerotis TaxID=1689449 RepID=A0A553JYB6_9ACTN|nr:F0F1 ATP synthase subunit gamma [Tessaracoccus rhinocerotis]TRY17446.1 F0F1 ATP synthase subunit gamma [Tessaracoccus rhinocerotis]